MIIDVFFDFFKEKLNGKVNGFELVKQNLQLQNQKQDTIVVSESGGKQPMLPDLIGEGNIDIVVLSKTDRLAYETANTIAETITNRFNLKFTLGESVYKFLSVLIEKRPLQVGYNGYSYQYNLTAKVKYSKLDED